jgi:hypothetical protein
MVFWQMIIMMSIRQCNRYIETFRRGTEQAHPDMLHVIFSELKTLNKYYKNDYL